MKKWITSNYHYMVPECDESTQIQPHWDNFLNDVRRGIQFLGQGVVAAPVVLGPVTLTHLTKKSGPWTNETLLGALLPAYKQLLQELALIGVKEIQVHEPALVFADPNLLGLYQMAYPGILPDGPAINIVTFMDDIGSENYKWVISEPKFSIISLDFTRGKTLELVEAMGFPVEKTLGAGLIDGRNVWKFQPDKIVPMIQRLRSKISNIRIQPSSTLQYVPWDFGCETELQNHPAACVLSFAKQKLQEIGILAKFACGEEAILLEHSAAWKNFAKAVPLLPQKLHSPSDLERPEPYSQRRPKQLVGVPLLPTTTIGSFPQTAQIRRLRTQWKNGTLTQKEYEAAIDQQIAYAIGIQEALGLDILVHGEAERTDMVEFFAKQMEGLIFTQNGWVQSFGSRCVRPPIIWMNISRPKSMTVREFQVAQALTSKPVKGMLTGPMTILNWSFPRIDIPRKDQAFQLALAIRKEVEDLEAAGCRVIQVDEPALREAMPLRSEDKDEYLDWAVDSFRLATAVAKSETQIHTHMCYCEFRDCMHAIDRMDTDVNSIENARNGNETLEAFVAIHYQKGFGPGVYDIHSPVVLPVAMMQDKIQSFLQCLEPEKLVINPDCGLKTRTWPETISALQNMVAAAKEVRQALGITSS
jgi:5-methyltetrahydropteroyltriglutamate--homocysteine methyltransferase